MTPPLTALYVPGDRPDRFAKAARSGADVVILDLEDAVSPQAKVTARDHVVRWLAAGPTAVVQVRINDRETEWYADDLAAITDVGGEVGIRVPKVGTAAALTDLAARATGHPLHPLIETAGGVEDLTAIARVPGVASIGLGEADLASELGFDDDEPLAWVRTRLVIAARAAGLPPPMMSVWTDLQDMDGLRVSCAVGRRRGFLGRTAIHPRQLPVIVDAFVPSEVEIARARAVLEGLAAAGQAGSGVSVLPDGRMIDAAMRQAAERTVALADRAGR